MIWSIVLSAQWGQPQWRTDSPTPTMLIFILCVFFNFISQVHNQSIDPTPASTTTSGSPKAGCTFEGESCEFLEEKILSIIPNIPTVDQCNSLCQENPDCTFSTHFGPEGFPLFTSCVLFSSCDILHSCSDRGERIVFWGPNTNTNIIRLPKNDRIRIRILFGFPKMT